MIEYPAIGANTKIELKEKHGGQFSSAGCRPGRTGLPLHARHIPRRQKRRRVPRECSVAFLHRAGGAEDRMSVKICIVGCGAIGSSFRRTPGAPL